MRLSKKLFLGLAALSLGTLTAQAQTKLGTFGKWSSFTAQTGGEKVCYMASSPDKSEGNYTKRGAIFAMLSNFGSVKNQFSYYTGYTYRQDSTVTLSIDGQTYSLFTKGERAWASDTDDSKIASAVRKGKQMVVTGYSSRGTKTVDTFSLTGTSQAYKTMHKTCP